MTAKHTSGPWEAFPDVGPRWAIATAEKYVAVTANDNDEANARLIAAAPEMLEALKALVEEFRFAHVPKVYAATHPVNVAQAVIAKAEGRE